MTNKINEVELAQLGTIYNDNYSYIKNISDWLKFRGFLLEKSTKRNNDYFDPDLAAYTPGETLELLNHPKIKKWFKNLEDFTIPENVKAVVLVPCAASKPWFNHKNVNKSKLYKAYNQIINEIKEEKFPNIYFLTISEPLGIVPQENWNNFPKYDNPGLFKDDFLRTGLVKTDWDRTFLKTKHILPFDEIAYNQCIEKLAKVIENTLKKIDVPIISFVDAKEHTTHGDMLDNVHILNPSIQITRHMKKDKARTSPYEHLKEKILEQISYTNIIKKKL